MFNLLRLVIALIFFWSSTSLHCKDLHPQYISPTTWRMYMLFDVTTLHYILLDVITKSLVHLAKPHSKKLCGLHPFYLQYTKMLKNLYSEKGIKYELISPIKVIISLRILCHPENFSKETYFPYTYLQFCQPASKTGT